MAEGMTSQAHQMVKYINKNSIRAKEQNVRVVAMLERACATGGTGVSRGDTNQLDLFYGQHKRSAHQSNLIREFRLVREGSQRGTSSGTTNISNRNGVLSP
ncbi:hypothetical protein J6590_027034 [Homalodisca vitripennis]|nr:hypothetical protein J6590_027034 [Homalodisca vitripennis]